MKIAVLAGDGIGPEITAQALRVLQALGSDGLRIETEAAPVGGAGFDASGDPLPEATLKLCEQSDAILFGAVGGPRYDTLPRPQRPEQGLLRLRKQTPALHAGALLLWDEALLPPQVAGLSSVLVPVVAMVSGAIVHREPLGPVQIVAMLCCCGALALTLVVPAKAAAVER